MCISWSVAFCLKAAGIPLNTSARWSIPFIARAVAGLPSSAVCTSCCFDSWIFVDNRVKPLPGFDE